MKYFLSDIRRIERQGFLLSFLLHLLVFTFFVVIFPAQSVAHKPLLVFLGSILESHDFIYNTNIKGGQKIYQYTQLPIPARASQFHSSDNVAVAKPTFYENVDKKPKLYVKSTFKEEPKAAPNSDLLPEELGIDVRIPKRRPLSLNYQ